MRVNFVKMHALGNDMVIVDGLRQSVCLSVPMIRAMADRRRGIGFDQLLVVRAAKTPTADFICDIFNADGSSAMQCGNWLRCVARFLIKEKLTEKSIIRVAVGACIMPLSLRPDRQIQVDMGPPVLPTERWTSLKVGEAVCTVALVAMPNPHALLFCDTVDEAPVSTLGAQLSAHPHFPEGTNVEFVQVMDRNRMRVRVYERGVGETQACGSGACAAVVVGVLEGLVDAHVRVTLPGGDLEVHWSGGLHDSMLMVGPAEEVFRGSYYSFSQIGS